MPRDTSKMETWETTTNSSHSINTYNSRGEKTSKVVGGRAGQRFQITAEEREELNEEVAVDRSVDPFRNGFLRPLRNVPEDVMARFQKETVEGVGEEGERHEIGGLTTEQMVEALESKKGNPFNVWVERLDEPTLRRLAEIAPEADAAASQLAAIDKAMEKYKVTLRETGADAMLRRDPETPRAPVTV